MNRYLPSRALLVLGLGLTLVACDSSEEQDAEAIVGRWNFGTATERTLVTVNEAQQVIDRTQPGQGSLQATGDVTTAFRYLDYSYRDGDREGFYLSSYDRRTAAPSYPYYELSLSNEGSVQLYVVEDEDGSGASYSSFESSGYTRSGNVLTVDGVTLTNGAGGAVMIDGTLTFATRSVPANQETEIDRETYDDDYEDDFQLEFEEDGTYRFSDDNDSEGGTWEVVGDGRLRLTSDEDEDDATVVSYQIAGSTLSLTADFDECDGDDEECLRFYEGDYLLEEGSLTRIRYEERLTLTRASSNSAVPNDGASARGDRPSTRPWSARPAPMRKGIFGTSR